MSKQASYLSSNGISELLGSRPGFLTIQAAAYYASVSPRTIKRWIARGLPSFQGSLRGKVLIKPGDIDLFVQKKPIPVAKHDLDMMVEGVLKSFHKATASGRIPLIETIPASGSKSSTRQRGKWARASKKGTVPDSTGNVQLNQGL